MDETEKFYIQESQYEFPYHYLPCLKKGAGLRLHHHLPWGLDYMTYMSFIVELLTRNNIKSLLDIGCGDGRLIHMVKEIIPEVLGIDLSKRAIAFARAFNPNVDFVIGDISAISTRYNWITLIEVIEHIPEKEVRKFIGNVVRLLRDDGRLLISVPTVNIPVNKKHYRHFNVDSLKASIEPYLHVEKEWWLYKQGKLERLIRILLCNRFWLLNFPPMAELLWRLHKRWTYFADSSTGSHLVCLAKIDRTIDSTYAPD